MPLKRLRWKGINCLVYLERKNFLHNFSEKTNKEKTFEVQRKLFSKDRCTHTLWYKSQYFPSITSYLIVPWILFSHTFLPTRRFFLYNQMKNIMFYRRVWVMSCTRWLHSTHSTLLLRIWILYTESRLWNLRLPGKLSKTAIREILNGYGDKKFK